SLSRPDFQVVGPSAQAGGIISGGASVTGTGTPTPGRAGGASGSGWACGPAGSAGGAGGGSHGRIDSARATAAALSTGLFSEPSQTTNQRSGARCPRGVPGGVGEPTTPAQICPLGRFSSVNSTS